MAREKGTGSLQQEKSGRWTIRVGIDGKRISRSAGTKSRPRAEAFLERFLSPLGLGARRIPLSDAWAHYETSPNRRDISAATLSAKRLVWMRFARWMADRHIEAGSLADITDDAVSEYLAHLRRAHSATTYNNNVCVLREVFRVLADKAGVTRDPWARVCLRADDSISRRELSVDELERLHAAASGEGPAWRLLVTTGMYTGLRLGDCCLLRRGSVDLARGIIQLVPSKTKRHAHGRPVTIPIHPCLAATLRESGLADAGRGRNAASGGEGADGDGYVNPEVAEMYLDSRWRINDRLGRIFKAAKIEMSVLFRGRARKSVIASFHSLRHTFVSLAANAGVPLAAVQSIVGHCSSAMTRHYYHESEETLRRAVAAIPAVGARAGRDAVPGRPEEGSAAKRLAEARALLDGGLVTQSEYCAIRARILAAI